MKRQHKGSTKSVLTGLRTGSEPQVTHGDGSADSALNSICRAAKQPTGESTSRYTSGGKKGYGY